MREGRTQPGMSAATRRAPTRRAALSALLDRAGGAGTDPGLALELTI